jgi:hypothetical protein
MRKILDNHSSSGFQLQQQFVQGNYSILMKFFDTFEKFDFIKPYLPIRDMAKSLALRRQEKAPAPLSWFQSVSNMVGSITSEFSFH